MQTHDLWSRPSEFSQGLLHQEQRIRQNLAFAGQTNRSMQEGIESARRKLNSSASTGFLRSQPDNRNLVIRPQRDQLSQSQTPQHVVHSILFRKQQPEVPEERDDYLGQLKREVAVLKRENEGLKQAVTQNDASARFTIGQLQNELDVARAENQRARVETERLRNVFEKASKQTNDDKSNVRIDSTCFKCPRLQARIQDLQAKIDDLNRQLKLQISRKNEVSHANETFRAEMSGRLQSMEGWLRTRNEQIIDLQQRNLEISRRMTERERQFNKQITSITQEYYSANQAKQKAVSQTQRLYAQIQNIEKKYGETQEQLIYITNKVQSLAADAKRREQKIQLDFRASISQLQQKLAEMRYRLKQRASENRELEVKLGQKDSNFLRLSEEYSSALERIEQLEESGNNFRTRNEEMQAELQRIKRSELAASLDANQLLKKYLQLEHMLLSERENTQQIHEQLQNRQKAINQLQTHLNQTTQSYHTLQLYSESEIRKLTQTISTLASQHNTVTQQNLHLKLTISKRGQQEWSEARQQATVQREELFHRLQQAQTALEKHNKQPLSQYRRIGELEELVYTLRKQQEQNISRLQSSNRQIIRIEQEKNILDQSGREALKSLKYQNQILAKQNRELVIQIQLGQGHLEKAENYIAQILDKHPKQDSRLENENSKIKQQLLILTEDKRKSDISLQSQIRLRKELQIKVDQMNIFVLTCKQQFERNAEEAKKELRILQEMCGALPGKDDLSQKSSAQKPSKRPDLEQSSQISKSELLQVQIQNQLLKNRLIQAEDYISHINRQLKDRQIGIIQLQSHSKKAQQSYSTIQKSSKAEIRRLNESISTLTHQNLTISEQVSKLKEKGSLVQTIKNQLNGKEEENIVVKNQLKDVIAEKQAIRNHLVKAEEYIVTLIEEIKTKDSVLVQIESAIADNKNISIQKATLIEENKTLCDKIEQISKLRARKDNQEINNLKGRKQQLEIRLANAEQNISQLLAEVKQYRNSSYKNEKQSLKQQNEILLIENRRLTELYQSLSSQNQAVNKQLQQISAEKQTLVNQNQGLSQQFQQIIVEKQKLKHIIQQNKVQISQEKLAENSQIIKLQRDNSQLQEHLQKAETHIAFQQTLISQLKQKEESYLVSLSQERQTKIILQKTLSVAKKQTQDEKKKKIQLQDLVYTLKKQRAEQQKKIQKILLQHSALKQQKTPEHSYDAVNQKISEIQQQKQAFKKKLIQAQEFIYQYQKELSLNEAAARQLQIKYDRLVQQTNKAALDNSKFFENKLFQAERYIVQQTEIYIKELQTEKERIEAGLNAKENEVNLLKEEIYKLKQAERQQNTAKLQDVINNQNINIELKDKQLLQLKLTIAQISNQASEKLKLTQDVKKESEKIIKSMQVQAYYLQIESQQAKQKVQSLQKRINQLESEKYTANDRANYSEGLLMQTVKRLQEQKSQNNQTQLAAFKDSLNQAEKYIIELQAVNYNLQNQLTLQTAKFQDQQAKSTQAVLRGDKFQQEIKTVLLKLQEAESQIFTLSAEYQKIKQETIPKGAQISSLRSKLVEVEVIIDNAESENKNLKEKLSEAQAYIQTRDQETKKLKDKLIQVESHIEEDRNKLKSKLLQSQQQILTFQQQRKKLKSIQISPSPQKQAKKDENKQQITALHQQIRRLNLERDINNQRLQSKQAQIKALSSALQNLSQQKTEVQLQQSEEDAIFFKNKLLQAQQYIEQMEHVNLLNEQTLNQRNEEVKQLAFKAASLQNSFANAEKARNTLISELTKEKEINNKLKEAATTKISSTGIINLHSKINQLEVKLAESHSSVSKQIRNNQQLAKKITQLTSAQAILRQEKADSDRQASFFKDKLFQAENYITQLEQASNTNEELTGKIKQIMLLQDKLKEIEKTLLAQTAETEKKEVKLTKLEKKVHENEEESQFFRKKLLQAQTYINHLEQALPKVDDAATQELKSKLVSAEHAANNFQGKLREIETKNKELSLMNEQLLAQLDEKTHSDEIRRLQDSLIQLRSALNESQANNRNLQSRIAEESVGSRVTSDTSQQEFFKNKLLQAESYIRELQEENTRYGEKIDEVDTLKGQLQEMQEKNNMLAVQVDRLEHERAQQAQIISKLQAEVAVQKQKIEKLEIEKNLINEQKQQSERKIKQAENNISEAQVQLQKQVLRREQAEKSAKKYEQLSISLQDSINIIQNIPRNFFPTEADQSKHKIEIQFLAEKLKQAEQLIAQQQNEVSRLTDEIIRLQNDSSIIKRKLSSHRREEEDMEQALRQLSTSRQDLVERIEPLENSNETLRSQIRQAKQTIAELQQQKKRRDVQTAYPVQQQHQKFIELQAEVLQLKQNRQQLETALQQAQTEVNGLKQIIAQQQKKKIQDAQSREVIKQIEEKQKQNVQLSQKITNINLVNEQLTSQNEQLKRKLQQIKPKAAEIDSLTEKSRQLQRELSEKDEFNGQLQTAVREANESVEEMQNHIQNLSKAHSKTIATLQQQVQKAAVDTTDLSAQLKQRDEIIQKLAPLAQEKQQLLRESRDLKERIQTEKESSEELLAKLAEAEEYIAQLEQEKNNADAALKKVLSNTESLRQQSEGLSEDLQKATAEKQRLLQEIKNLGEQMEIAQSENERLNSKISYLNSINEAKDQEIANLSQISKEKEKEIERLQRSSSNILQNTEQEHPQPKEGNVIPDEYKEEVLEEESSLGELGDQIRSLTAELQRKEEENRQLMVQRVNLQGQITELQQLHHDQELRQHLVEADRLNLQLQNQNQQLREQIQALAKEKAYLQYEIIQNKQKSAHMVPQLPLSTPQKEQTPIISENEAVAALRDENQLLNEQLQDLRARTEELMVFEVENDSLKHIKQALEEKIQAADAQKSRLLNKLALAEQALANQSPPLPEHHEQEMARKDEELASALQRIDELEAHFEQERRQEALGENLKKLLDLSNLNEDIDEDVMQQLENYPYLHQFINSLLYRLRLSSALELQKSLKIKQLTEELQNAQKEAVGANDLRAGNSFLSEEIMRLQQQLRQRENQEKAKYDEALQQLLYYSSLNKELQTKLAEISDIAQQQENRIKVYEQQISPLDTSQPSQENDLSQENYQLRRRLESSQRQLEKYHGDSSSSLNSKEVFYMQFLKGCLDKVLDLEREVQQVERHIEHAAEGTHRSQPSLSHQDDTLQQRLQQLQQKLVRNAQNIKEHQQRSDNELYQLLKDLSELKELPEASRNRIDEYLSQLEAQILREHDQHQSEVSRLREQVAALSQQSARSNQSRTESPRGTREELLRQIMHLNNAIEIYYQQSMRRKKNYLRTIEGLLTEIEELRVKQLQGNSAEAIATATTMAEKLANILDKEEDEDAKQLQMGDDFIISGNHMQILDSREKSPLPALEEQEERGVQTEQDPKPFLAFLLSNPFLQKEDLRLLKKKVAELRGRQVQESLLALRGQEKRLEQVLQLGARDPPQQMENIMLTIANTYSRDEISQIFGSEDNDEILNKLNEALCLEESFYRGQNSSTMLQNILQRKNKYYQSQTKLSEQVYRHLINLLSAKRDEEFYESVDALFHDLYQTEVGFEEALKKKDEMYRAHNQRMNQIFNRSSSDGSEEYMNVFQNNPNNQELEMHSERKPRRSQPDSEAER